MKRMWSSEKTAAANNPLKNSCERELKAMIKNAENGGKELHLDGLDEKEKLQPHDHRITIGTISSPPDPCHGCTFFPVVSNALINSNNSTIQSLHFHHPEIAHAEGIVEILKNKTAIKELRLIDVSHSQCITIIAKALKQNNDLQQLVIRGESTFDLHTCYMLADMLKNNSSLLSFRWLNLQRQEAEKANPILQAMTLNNTLTSFELTHANLDSNGMALLSDILKRNTLTRLSLPFGSFNKTDDLIVFANGIKQNTSLLQLNLGCFHSIQKPDNYKFDLDEESTDILHAAKKAHPILGGGFNLTPLRTAVTEIVVEETAEQNVAYNKIRMN